ncbi:hypothetical protein [Candidatus Pelagibacter sp.]|uniref:hypothetical protein n=1 Tax=Candidatus Pelagibacter sp. TaxID=2024849 RepID=UPI003F852E67
MKKKLNKITSDRIKYIYFILIFIFLIYFTINFVFSFFQNKILSILQSQKFENFVILRVESYLEKLSEGELTEKQIEYYSNLLKRINQKFKPVTDKLKK